MAVRRVSRSALTCGFGDAWSGSYRLVPPSSRDESRDSGLVDGFVDALVDPDPAASHVVARHYLRGHLRDGARTARTTAQTKMTEAAVETARLAASTVRQGTPSSWACSAFAALAVPNPTSQAAPAIPITWLPSRPNVTT